MAALTIIQSFFGAAWDFLTGLTVPGIGISFASWFVALILAGISIKLAAHLLGFGGSSYRSGDSRRKHISENRKGDEK